MKVASSLVLSLGCLPLGCLLLGCIDTGEERVSIPLLVSGVAVGEPIEAQGGFAVNLERAELAFGPLYLCAGALAGDNCEAARLEWLESAVVDALDPTPREVGWLTGASGPVRSGMYDLGIASLLALPQPLPLAASQALAGNSVRLSGTATRAAENVPFSIELPIQQGADAEIGVSVIRVSGAQDLVHDVSGEERALSVRFDPRAWVREIDFELAPAGGAVGGEGVDASGNNQAHRAVRTALLSGERPRFEWISGP